MPPIAAPMTLGLERLLRDPPDELMRGRRIGLITNHTGVDRLLRQNIDLMRAAGFNVVALFGPEHGVRGDAQAGAHVADAVDARTGLPVHSLYGPTREPTPRMLDGVEALVFDIADIGARFYTYPYTMAHCMTAAAGAGLPFYVLDRPNPINGVAIEGPVLEPGLVSFVGMYPIPTRHGMTIGELARHFNRTAGIGCDLTVVPMDGWTRGMFWDDTGLPFVPPSPNAPTPDMALLYPGTCHVEGTNLSEGRGTTRPFEVVGAPWIDGMRWADALNDLDLPGVRFRPTSFTPTFGKHHGIACGGVQAHVLDRDAARPVRVGMMMLQIAFAMWPEACAFLPPEGDGGVAPIDRLAGTTAVRRTVEAGGSMAELCDTWAAGVTAFADRRAADLLYE